MPTVGEWLASIGMSEYAELFSANRIDSAVLPDLTDHDLEKLGVVLGDRRKILRAIRELGEASETAQPRVGVELHLHDAAERRQLSVMFVDLVSSTELSAKTRSGGYGPGYRRVSKSLRDRGDRVRRLDRQVHGRWSARLFRLPGSA